MSHQLILAALAITFVAIWALICLTAILDGLSEVRRRRAAMHGPHFSGNPERQTLKKRPEAISPTPIEGLTAG